MYIEETESYAEKVLKYVPSGSKNSSGIMKLATHAVICEEMVF